MKVYKAPEKYKQSNKNTIFLAGSIEMGKAEKWQDRLSKDFADVDIIFLNPRRDDWDSSWIQDPTPGTKFNEQVSWELEGLDNSDHVLFYFDKNTQSPITLLELGLHIDKALVVCCPKEYFRYGNVAIVCERYGVPIVHSYDELVKYLSYDEDELV